MADTLPGIPARHEDPTDAKFWALLRDLQSSAIGRGMVEDARRHEAKLSEEVRGLRLRLDEQRQRAERAERRADMLSAQAEKLFGGEG